LLILTLILSITLPILSIKSLLYAAKKAIGPRQLSEEETRNTARRAFRNNPGLTSSEIGKSIGSSRQAVDFYIAAPRAATQMDMHLKIFRMNRLGIPQERIAKRLLSPQQTISGRLPKLPGLANQPKADLSRGYTISKVAKNNNG